jgi:hypothetical protein
MRLDLDIDDELLGRADALASRRGIALGALIEESLEALLQGWPTAAARRFKLVTFGEGGLTEEAQAQGLHRTILRTYN